MQPAIGLLALTSFVSTETGVSETAYFDKSFRYSLNGVTYSDWTPLTTEAILGIPVTTKSTLVIELQYDKSEPRTGESVLGLTSVEIEATKQSGVAQNYFDKTVFKEFFDSDNVEVLNWYVNVLEKLYERGIVPNYIDRLNDYEQPDDFLDFWKSVAKFFSFFVIYARQFQKFYESEVLLSEFLEERGLKTSPNNTLEELTSLMKNYYYQMSRRGTISVVDRLLEGAEMDGELTRLIRCDSNDEFLFSLHRPEHIGWNIGNSSPMYRGLSLNQGLNKFAAAIEDYPIGNVGNYAIVIDEGHEALNFVGTFGDSGYKLKVSKNVDYEFSFMIKLPALSTMTVRALAYDKDLNITSLKSRADGTDLDVFVQDVSLSRSDKYLLVRAIFYNSSRTVDATDGQNLLMVDDTVWIAPFVDVTNGALIYNVKFLPLMTPHSSGFVQVNNWISCWMKNNNYGMGMGSVREFISRYLIPYNSHIKIIDLNKDTLKD
jgi:hypothetical protein